MSLIGFSLKYLDICRPHYTHKKKDGSLVFLEFQGISKTLFNKENLLPKISA